jgi:putative transposase
MPRIGRIVAVGQPHHITQRGNRRADVFFSPADREMYVALLRHYSECFELSVLGYCLMTNHVHLIAVPRTRSSLAKAIGRTHNDYSRWLNIRRREVGHLWQNRFHSCPLDERHLWAALRYVELNPVRAGLVQRASDWQWSTASSRFNSSAEKSWIDSELWRQSWDAETWKLALETRLEDADLLHRMREATRSGRPFGAPDFIDALERETGRPLRLQKRGPKPATAGLLTSI